MEKNEIAKELNRFFLKCEIKKLEQQAVNLKYENARYIGRRKNGNY
jgi:hypothetical protein